MLCQNCKINESTIHLYTNVNGNKQQIDLCQNCYQIMKTDPNNSLLGGLYNTNNQNIDPIDDFFNSLSNFQHPQEPNPNIPPTQSGGGYGGGGYGGSSRGGGQRQQAPQKPKEIGRAHV